MRPLCAALLAVIAAGAVAGQTQLRSGLDPATFDTAIRPQDDLYRFANGAWLAETPIPPDRVAFGAFQEVSLRVEGDLHRIITDVSRTPGRWGAEGRQIADLYASVMDEERLETAGLAPAGRQLERIQAIASPSELAAAAGELSATGAGGVFDGEIGEDPLRRGLLIVRINPGGVLLPDITHYIAADSRARDIRDAYVTYLTTIFRLIGRPAPESDARAVVDFETAIAIARHEAAIAGRAREGRFLLPEMMQQMPGFDWIAWARPQGLQRAAAVLLTEPAFFRRFAALASTTSLETLKLWLTARYLTSAAPFLSRAFSDARFELFGRVLTGQEAPTERWRRGVSMVSGYLGDALGRIYVERHVPSSSKRRVERLVETILAAYRDAIASSWWSDSAKAEARRKLDRLRVKIGGPSIWRSYRSFDVRPGDLLGNVERGRRHDAAFRMALGRGRIDTRFWPITPQTVIATYSPAANELIVPGAILQPPFFDPDAEDAVNYGAIGAIIGHEVSHALDDQGRRFDAGGRVRDWWSPADHAEYARRAGILIEQFNGYEPVAGARVDGARTMRENLNDLNGVALALAAYQRSRDGQAPVIDGLTGEQRFFLAWARVWRSKERDEHLRQWVRTIPHSPPQYRVNGIVGHIPAFYAAFGAQPGDRLYRDPAQRVAIWSVPRATTPARPCPPTDSSCSDPRGRTP